MSEISKKINNIKKNTQQQIETFSLELERMIRDVILNESKSVIKYVEQLKKLNPGISPEALCRKVISKKSLKAGGIGTITGMGGIISTPITMPANIYYTFKLQAQVVLAIAYIYGWDIEDEDIITDILLVLGGHGAYQSLKMGGIKIGTELSKKAVNKYITKEIMKKINSVITKKIITKAGEKSLTNFMKLIPLLGAPVGFSLDYIATNIVGKNAIKFYRE